MTASTHTDLHLLSKEIQTKCQKRDNLTLPCFNCIQKIVDYIYVSILNNLENDFFKKRLSKIQHKLIYLYKANKNEYSNMIDKDLIEDIVYGALGFPSNSNIKPFNQKEGGVFIIYCIMHYEFILFKKLNSISKLKALEYEKLNNEIVFNIDLNDIEDEIIRRLFLYFLIFFLLLGYKILFT